MDIERINKIKEIAIKAMFSNDELMDKLVLKGGNALDIIYKIAERASIDLDFSLDGDFPEAELNNIENKIRTVLEKNFKEEGFDVIDFEFREIPQKSTIRALQFWGGYKIEFKIIEIRKRQELGNNIKRLRINAEEIGPGSKKNFSIEISKYEKCDFKKSKELDYLTIFVYPLEMILFEKLRAICQQTPEYRKIVQSHNAYPRARDFFDIVTIKNNIDFDIYSAKNLAILEAIFDAKRVPLKLLNEIENTREFHRQNFDTIKDILKPGVEIKDFDYYFDKVLEICKKLQAFWEK